MRLNQHGYLAWKSIMASDLAGFRTICVKSNEKCVSYHYLYYKKHETREKDESKPQDKTLFVVNIPPYCTKVSHKPYHSCIWFLKGSSNKVDFREDKSAILMAHGEMSEKRPDFHFKAFIVRFICFKYQETVSRFHSLLTQGILATRKFSEQL